MHANDNVLHNYIQSLNTWHSELAGAASALKCLTESSQLTNLDHCYADLAYILQHRFDELVESCPFPSVDLQQKTTD